MKSDLQISNVSGRADRFNLGSGLFSQWRDAFCLEVPDNVGKAEEGRTWEQNNGTSDSDDAVRGLSGV